MPVDLAENFQWTIDRVRKQPVANRVRLAFKVFTWLVTAKRPLHIDELRHALATDHESSCFDKERLTPPRFLVAYCLGFVTVDRGGTIRFVHMAVFDFFCNQRTELVPDGDQMAAITCLTYLSFDSFGKSFLELDDDDKASDMDGRLQLSEDRRSTLMSKMQVESESTEKPYGTRVKTILNHPFLEYAVTYWGVHAANCGSDVVRERVESFYEKHDNFLTWADLDWKRMGCGRHVNPSSWTNFHRSKCVYEKLQNVTKLHVAARFDIEWWVDSAAVSYMDINCITSLGETALILSSQHGHQRFVEMLLSQPGINVNAVDDFGATALCRAVNSGQVAVVQTLMARDDLDINLGQPLFVAISSRSSAEMVEALLNSLHLNVNALGPDGSTALYKAASELYYDIALPILKRSDLRPVSENEDWGQLIQQIIEDQDIMTTEEIEGFPNFIRALIEAFWHIRMSGHGDVGISWFIDWASMSDNIRYVKEWVENGLDPLIEDDAGRTLLQVTACTQVVKTTFQLAELLLRKGLPPTTADKDGWSALHWALKFNNYDIMRLLVDNGAPASTSDKSGWSVLHLACGDFDATVFLVERGANPCATDNSGRAVLHSAVQKGSAKTIQYLIEKGADSSATDIEGWSVLHSACLRGDWDIIQLLLDNNAPVTPVDNRGYTVLYAAVRGGNEKAVETILKRGADPSQPALDGCTPLMLAASQDHAAVVKLLLDFGADVGAKHQAETALHYSAYTGNREICELLLKYGADPNIPDDRGETPLHIAARGMHNATLSLLRHGADLQVPDFYGHNPFDWVSAWPPLSAQFCALCKNKNLFIEKTSSSARRERLRESLQTTVKELLDTKSERRLLHTLGRLLLFLHPEDESLAQIAFEQTGRKGEYGLFKATHVCSECEKEIPGPGFVCTECASVYLCSSCFQPYSSVDRKRRREIPQSRVPWCSGHRFVEYPRNEWYDLEEGTINSQGQTFEEWLTELKGREFESRGESGEVEVDWPLDESPGESKEDMWPKEAGEQEEQVTFIPMNIEDFL